MDSKKPEELEEKNMIRNDGVSSSTLLIWLALVAITALLLWSGASMLLQKRALNQESTPFLQVTNRNFSLFLWQFPEYMRSNVSIKNGYLPGFQYMDKVSIEEGQSEVYVTAPPKVLFMYHVWDRLIRNEFPKRAISARELKEFLEYAPEWSPKEWEKAPKEYEALVATLSSKSGSLELSQIPQEVQRAVIGWKNYFLEGEQIKNVKPTYGEMAEFLAKYPNYARNFWRNIAEKKQPDYLLGMAKSNFDPKASIPEGELAGFLQVAFFNEQQAKKNL